MIIFNIQKEVFILSQNIIEIKNVSKTYGDNTVLNNLSLNIRKNEFLTLLGPSGCGKTTTLKILAGFENSDIGKVLFNDEDISALPPYKRQLNTVFQKAYPEPLSSHHTYVLIYYISPFQITYFVSKTMCHHTMFAIIIAHKIE